MFDMCVFASHRSCCGVVHHLSVCYCIPAAKRTYPYAELIMSENYTRKIFHFGNRWRLVIIHS